MSEADKDTARGGSTSHTLVAAGIIVIWGILLSVFPRYESIHGDWALIPEGMSVLCYLIAAIVSLGSLRPAGVGRFLVSLAISVFLGIGALVLHENTIHLEGQSLRVFLERIAVYALLFASVLFAGLFIPDLVAEPPHRDRMTSAVGYIITAISAVSGILTIYLFVFPPR